ncbi:MAG: hypothetical protein HRT72_04510 [Flavobacteriales bacterium]|nr:hypothetical protein [Flavobacteriales bacterium]
MEVRLIKISRLILSALFIFSGISKLLSLAFFDGMVAELFIGPDYFDHSSEMWYLQLFTRIIISGELLLGAALLQDRLLKETIIPTVQVILLAFTAHLFYEGTQRGFVDGNCGCFGDVLPMTNLESIIKNIVAMALGVFILKSYTRVGIMRFETWVMPLVIGGVTMATLFLTIKDYAPSVPVTESEIAITETTFSEDKIPPVGITDPEEVEKLDKELLAIETTPEEVPSTKAEEVVSIEKETEVKPLAQSSTSITKQIISNYAEYDNGTKLDLETGEKLICMFSLTCSHCQESYKDMCEMQADGGLPDVYLFVYGTEYDLNYFFNQAGGCKDIFWRTEDLADFKRMLEGEDFPRIIAFKEGDVVKTWNTDSYSEKSMRDFYDIKKKVKKANPSDGIEVGGGNDIWGGGGF